MKERDFIDEIVSERTATNPDFPSMVDKHRKKYSTILADPPWYETGGKAKAPIRHYQIHKTPQIIQIIKDSGVFRPAEDAHLYLWATNKFLRDGIFVMESLGFRYVTCITWAKPSMGIGQYFRGQTEHMLFGVKGRGFAVKTDNPRGNQITTLIESPGVIGPNGRRIHSAKPPESYELIERASKGPYLELFARRLRDGWDSWGNEV